jgi:hypothetical protein
VVGRQARRHPGAGRGRRRRRRTLAGSALAAHHGELGTGRQHPAVGLLPEDRQLGADAPAGRPARQASIFCLPTLPPLYLDILRQLSRWIDIRLYRSTRAASTGSRSSTASA